VKIMEEEYEREIRKEEDIPRRLKKKWKSVYS
jgi:hypothetical protein